MANPLRDFFLSTLNNNKEKRPLVEAFIPRRTFSDVILPASTRRALEHALAQINKHDLIFGQWGLAERHSTGLGLVFNFAGPPGTGKTICAEAIANALGRRLLIVRYSEMESLWAGETGKNVVAVFHEAREQNAVLFFDEADAIAGRRFAAVTQGYQREANTVVNVLLKELEEFDGVVIFATNLAANFDPAFERRIHTHILFEMPGKKERARIWQVQLHPTRTPLAPDVNFDVLAEKYEVSGGDIKNAVLKAAQFATGEPGTDAEKKIHQRHFEAGMKDVLAAKKVMDQTLFAEGDGSHPLAALAGLTGTLETMTRRQEEIVEEVKRLSKRLGEVEAGTASLPAIVERFDEAARVAQNHLRDELDGRLNALQAETHQLREEQGAQLAVVKDDHAALASRLAQLDDGQSTLQKSLEERLGVLSTQFNTQLVQALETERGHVVKALEAERTQLATLRATEEQEREAWREEWRQRWLTHLYITFTLVTIATAGIIAVIAYFRGVLF